MGEMYATMALVKGYFASPDMLVELFERGFISTAQRSAGVRLRQDYQDARVGGRVGFHYSPFHTVGQTTIFERTDLEEAAYGRWRDAVKAMKYPQSDAVMNVVCFDIAVPDLVLPHVVLGLTRLVAWYQSVDAQSQALGQAQALVQVLKEVV